VPDSYVLYISSKIRY